MYICNIFIYLYIYIVTCNQHIQPIANLPPSHRRLGAVSGSATESARVQNPTGRGCASSTSVRFTPGSGTAQEGPKRRRDLGIFASPSEIDWLIDQSHQSNQSVRESVSPSMIYFYRDILSLLWISYIISWKSDHGTVNMNEYVDIS